jgi:hypothetical protein
MVSQSNDRLGRKDAYPVGRLRVGKRGSWVRVVADGVSGIASITELCEQVDVVGALDAAGGSIEQWARGHWAGVAVGRAGRGAAGG